MADMRAYVLPLGLLSGRHERATQPDIDSEPEAHP
jgi:hypothetical protein